MKSLYFFIFTVFIYFIPDMPSRLTAQCSADYTTTNNFCDLDSLYLTAIPIGGIGPYTFLWETGDTTQTISIPLALGDYLVTITDATGCVAIINCHIKPFPTVLYYPYNQNACEGDTVTLFLEWFRDSIPGATYLWSTGETTPTIQITDDIVWSVTVTDPNTGCEYVIPPGLFDFHPTPYPEIVGPTMLCPGQTAILSVNGGPFGTIIWYPGAIYEPTLEVTEPGTYMVWGSSVEAGYCWHQDTITILPGDINPPELTGPQNLCEGQNGLIEITNSSSYQTFIWSNGETTPSINVNQPGTYTVTVTNAGGCTSTGEYTVGPGPGANLSFEAIPSSCGENNGGINLTVTPAGTYTYLWSNGNSSEDINNIPGGNYEVTVTSLDGCTSTANINVPDILITINIAESITPVTSCNVDNGAIDISVTPPGAYVYAWSTGASTQDLDNLPAGTYTVTVTLGLTCILSDTFEVINQSSAPNFTSSILSATCGESNGAIDLQVNSGTPPFTFLWSTGSTEGSIVNVPAGSYFVTVTGSDGCITIGEFEIPDQNIDFLATGLITPATSCTGENGAIDLEISPPGTYSFSWSNGETSEDLMSIPPGSYTVTITLGLTCMETATFEVPSGNEPIEFTGITTPNTSCGLPNGSIDITVTTPGTFTYNWSNGASTEDIDNLASGTYVITIQDVNSCTATATFTLDNAIQYPLISSQPFAATCGMSNGSIDISVIPQNGNNFQWSNGSTEEDLSNLPAGTYMVTVTDENGCSVSDTILVISQNSNFTIAGVSTANNNCLSPNGSIDLTVIPSGSYVFQWSDGSTSEDLFNLSPGSYSVTVTDSLLCASSAIFIIENTITQPVLQATITPTTCGSANGSIDLEIIPAINISVLWSTGSTSEDLQNISAGSYSVIVTDGNGCQSLDTFIVQSLNNNFALSATSDSVTSCITPNGAIDLSIVPPGNYTYSWSNGAVTEDLTGLSAGQYTVTVTDQLLCSSTASIEIYANTEDPVLTAMILPSTCGLPNGSIQLTVVPTSGNSYIWSNGSNDEDIQDLSAGIYTITVTGANGCSSSDTFSVPEQNSVITLSAAQVPNTNCMTPNGAIDLSVTPSGLYTFLWSDGSTAEDPAFLAPGTYQVTVTDVYGCSAIGTYLVESLIIMPMVSSNITPSICGEPNGHIDVTVTPPGAYTYIWSTGTTGEDIQGLGSGTYSITVTGTNECTASAEFFVPNENNSFTLSAEAKDNTSCTVYNGTLDITVNPPGFYQFTWSNGSTSEDLQDLSPGTYSVTVSDINHCISTATYSISDAPELLEGTGIVHPLLCEDLYGSIDLSIIPPTGNNFSWSTGSVQEDLINVPPGIYSVTVTGQSGCTWSSSFTIENPEIPDISISAEMIHQGGDSVTIRVEASIPMDAIDTVIWFPGTLFACYHVVCLEQTIAMPVSLTQVMVMVMDTHGCMAQASLVLDLSPDPKVYIPNVFSPNDDGINDYFTLYGNKEVDEIVELRIFDRWGNSVFIKDHFPPNDERLGWDGKFRSKDMNQAVFAYWAQVRFLDGSEQFFKGDVTLLR